MLQYGTVEPGTLELLKTLMSIPEFSDFYLVGGTALSLYYGHRKSVDIDIFSITDFDAKTIIPVLEKHFTTLAYNPNNAIGLFSFIDDVKVDFVSHHNFKMIDAPFIENGIRLMSVADIAAIFIAAILRRGVKKDFWDISELLHHYTVEDFINFYNKKFPNQQLLISIPQALTYFADAEDSENPISLKKQTWAKVKKHIQKEVSNYLR